MDKLQNFFSKKYLLILAPILYFIGSIGMNIFQLVYYDAIECALYYLGSDIFVSLAMLIVCLSFAKHNKNVLKALVGGLLVYTTSMYLNDALGNALYYEYYEYDISDIILGIIMAVLYIVLLVNHLVLASNHKQSKFIINFNLIVGILIIATAIVWEVLCIFIYETNIIYAILWILYASSVSLLVMNIESKINYFKQIRDEKESETEVEA